MWFHPEWWVIMFALVAWAMMIGLEQRLPLSGRLTQRGSMVGHVASEVVLCLAMTVAMMFPLIVPHARHVSLSSYWRRRHRAMAAFVVGYLALWLLTSFTVLAALHVVHPFLGERGTVAVAFGTAAVWQLTRWKRRALVGCHRLTALTADGWRADTDCARFGATIGQSCACACWGLMLAVMSTHALAAMALLFPVQLWERGRRRRRMDASAIFIAALSGLFVLWSPG
jgi:hypothetical protein